MASRPSKNPKDCTHQEFTVKAKATYLANVQRYILEVALRCADCHERFAFDGLPISQIALNGACMNPDGGVARLAIRPMYQELPPLDDMPIASLPEAPPQGAIGQEPDDDPEMPTPTDFQVIE